MFAKTFTIAAIALATATGAASADMLGKTQAGAALFDQGGEFYNGPDARHASQQYGLSGIDRTTTASTGRLTIVDQEVRARNTGVPSDTRNERGLGLFDVVQ